MSKASRLLSVRGPPAPPADTSADTNDTNDTNDSVVKGGRSLRVRKSDTGPNYQALSDDSFDSPESEGSSHDGGGKATYINDVSSASSASSSESDDEPDAPLPERGTGSGRSLRPRASLYAPEQLEEYVDTELALGNTKVLTKKQIKQRAKKRAKNAAKKLARAKACGPCRVARMKCDGVKPECGACVKFDRECVHDGVQKAGPSLRSQERAGLDYTKMKRDAFLVQYKELFAALLPERNYIAKMLEKRQAKEAEAEEKDRTEEGDADDEEEHVVETKPHKVVPYKLLEHQPEHVTATMKPYQLGGLSFLVWLYENGANGILGDEMGLGKTLQTLSLFSYLTTYRPNPKGHHRPFLVVCPLSVVSSWVSECKRWTPHLSILRFHGPAQERTHIKTIANGFDIVVTSYEIYERERTWFGRAFVWRYAVLDEGHKIKNDKSNIATALQGLATEFRLILTGTPLQNNLTELWALLHWLYPEVFVDNTASLFAEAFDLTNGKNNLQVMDDARKILELMMLRRMKESSGVNLGLPPKTELIMFLPLTPMQRFWYKRLLTRLDKGLLENLFANSTEKVKIEEGERRVKHEHLVKDEELDEEMSGEQWGETRQMVEKAVQDSKTDGKWRKLMNLLMQLRKCCDHPYLLSNNELEEDDEAYASLLVLASSKMIFLDKLVEELCMKQGKKVLIFSGFTKMLNVCEDLLLLKGGDGSRFKYGRLDGGTPRARRNLGIHLFNSNPEYKIMLISTRAGGLGINLATASDVVMLESDWNPQVDLQAQARAHRIGQKNPVTIYRLVTQGTVEEQMMGRIRKKLYLSAKVTETMRDIHTSTSSVGLAGSAAEEAPTLSTGQLVSLVRAGSRAIARPEIDPTEMLKWDWETTIAKCKDYANTIDDTTAANAAAAATAEEEEKEWLSEMERVESRIFEGKHHVKAAPTYANVTMDFLRSDRRADKNRVVYINGHPVLRETIGNAQWEAVATFAGKDPRLADPPKMKRKAIAYQEYCQVCRSIEPPARPELKKVPPPQPMLTCAGCPRVYHGRCLMHNWGHPGPGMSNTFYCPQHECDTCHQKTSNAGGMIYRCRWCPRGFCEDCLDWDGIKLEGDQVPEMECLEYAQKSQAFWIVCGECKDDKDSIKWANKCVKQAEKKLERQEAEWEKEQQKLAKAAIKADSKAFSVAGGSSSSSSKISTPAVGSGVATPASIFTGGEDNTSGADAKKRKRKSTVSAGTAGTPSASAKKVTKKAKAAK